MKSMFVELVHCSKETQGISQEYYVWGRNALGWMPVQSIGYTAPFTHSFTSRRNAELPIHLWYVFGRRKPKNSDGTHMDTGRTSETPQSIIRTI